MDDIIQMVTRVVRQVTGLEVEVELKRPNVGFGDFATNVAMQLAGKLGDSPRHIAEKIAAGLGGESTVASVEVAGPGFINLRLTDKALLQLAKSDYKPTIKGEVVVIETNNPNPFKAMHIGHAYNAILADAMANLLETGGAAVRRVSYHGDVGLHVGKSMWAILRDTGGDVDRLRQIPEDKRNSFMSQMYAAGSKAYKQSEEARAEIDQLARESFVLEDENFKEIYQLCTAWSYDEIDSTVARLGNKPTERRYVESETEAPGKQLIISKTPEVFSLSDGAYIFKGSKHGSFDNAYIGSNGNGLYGAHDMGLIQMKYADFPKLDRSIVVTGSEQGAYFKGVIAASELAMPELKGKLYNYPTGLVKLSTGKMSSRDGDVVEISWLFDEFARAIEARGGTPDDEIIAGALRYQFLRVKVGSDVVFDIDSAVSLTGDTGSYLQYAHARAARILENASSNDGGLESIEPEDRGLIAKIGRYAEVVEQSVSLLEPHHLCAYLFDLAQEFNRYYEKNRVIGSPREAERLALTKLYITTLKSGLSILGIVAPERM